MLAAMLIGPRCDVEDDRRCRRDEYPAPRACRPTSAVREAIQRTIVDTADQLNVTPAIGLGTSPNCVLIRDTATRTMPNSIWLLLYD